MNLIPLVLLDVDGVLNAIPRGRSNKSDPSVWSDWSDATAHADGTAFPIRYSPTVTAAVRGWHDNGLADVRWLTTWADDANGDLRAVLGLPEFPVAGSPPLVPGTTAVAAGSHAAVSSRSYTDDSGWWKLSAVKRLVAADPTRPVVWLDDDLRWETGALSWFRKNVRGLALAPHTHLGLTPKLLATVDTFLAPNA